MISVVVPVFNVERYLEKCIDSILNQTFSDLEIIIVDDGSTDGSAYICDQFKMRDERVKVIHKENGGLSDARNVGLREAKGEYICFIDSDDYISSIMIESLIVTLQSSQADVAICAKKDISEADNNADIEASSIKPDNSDIIVLTPEEAFKHFLLEDIDGFVVAWNKLYRRKLFVDNEIAYPKGKIHEDCFTTYKLFLKSNRIVYFDLKLYFYRHRNGSIMRGKDISKDVAIIEAAKEVLDLTIASYSELIDAAEYRYILDNLYCADKALSNKELLCLFSNNIKNMSCKNKYLKGQKKIRAYVLKKHVMMYPMFGNIRNIIKILMMKIK